MKSRFIALLGMLMLPALALAQSSIRGTVTDAETNEPLVGANVLLVSTSFGTATDADGKYEISGVPAGSFTLRVDFIGYTSKRMKVTVSNTPVQMNVALEPQILQGTELQVVANRATERETPVAFSNVSKETITKTLGSRDIPVVLNTTPGVYATAQGGGAGDARINVRGFNQRNIAVMINGIPVNDMENGWVYWSNWDGLGDVTSSIQVQRGLGASNLAIASVGGTLNILTDVASFDPGLKFKQEVGNDGFLKSTAVLSTGLMDNGLAATVAGVRKVGDGVVEQTWTDAYAYFAALSYQANRNHKLDLFLIGAPQRHGHRLYEQSLATWDKEYAAEQGVDVTNAVERGRLYNPNWGPLDAPASAIKEYYNGSIHDWREPGIIMERENYYHKPQLSLNWYWALNNKATLTNVLYYSRGKGGGTGGYGDRTSSLANGQIDYQSVYNANIDNIDTDYSSTENRATSILRNSVNQHYWYGWIGSLDYKLQSNLKLRAGIDGRYYIGEHWREVRNLLGGDYYIDTRDQNQSTPVKRLGDRVNYHNDGLTRWVGAFGQLEGKFDKLTAVGLLSLSSTGYKRKDYFLERINGQLNETDWQNIGGWTAKAGANYNVSDYVNVYANAGLLSKAPDFDAVYNFDNTVYAPLFNEKVTTFELGTGLRRAKIAANINAYYTEWKDRTFDRQVTSATLDQTFYYLIRGVDARHMGVELDLTARPNQYFELRGMVSIGDYEWLNDVITTFAPEEDPTAQDDIAIYTAGLKVGDSAQKSFALSGTVFPTKGLSLNATLLYFADHYADFDPVSRTTAGDRTQPWQVPNYGLVHLHGTYALPITFGRVRDVALAFHVFNLFDTKYVSDANDRGDHTASAARVYFGLPRTFNIGFNFGL